MGCTPTAIKDKNKIPPINSYPSNRQVTNPPSLDIIISQVSKLTPKEFDEICRCDIQPK